MRLIADFFLVALIAVGVVGVLVLVVEWSLIHHLIFGS